MVHFKLKSLYLVLESEENKYGRMRLRYLKEHKKAEYTILFMEGKLKKHLKKIQETATKRIDDIITKLKAESNLTEDMKFILGWYNECN